MEKASFSQQSSVPIFTPSTGGNRVDNITSNTPRVAQSSQYAFNIDSSYSSAMGERLCIQEQDESEIEIITVSNLEDEHFTPKTGLKLCLKLLNIDELKTLQVMLRNEVDLKFLNKIQKIDLRKISIDEKSFRVIIKFFDYIGNNDSVFNLNQLSIGRIRKNFTLNFLDRFDDLRTLSIGNISDGVTLDIPNLPEKLDELFISDVNCHSTVKLPEASNLSVLSIGKISYFATFKFSKILDHLEILTIACIHSGAILKLPNSLNNLIEFHIDSITLGNEIGILLLSGLFDNLNALFINEIDVDFSLDLKSFKDLRTITINSIDEGFQVAIKLPEISNNLKKICIDDIQADTIFKITGNLNNLVALEIDEIDYDVVLDFGETFNQSGKLIIEKLGFETALKNLPYSFHHLNLLSSSKITVNMPVGMNITGSKIFNAVKQYDASIKNSTRDFFGQLYTAWESIFSELVPRILFMCNLKSLLSLRLVSHAFNQLVSCTCNYYSDMIKLLANETVLLRYNPALGDMEVYLAMSVDDLINFTSIPDSIAEQRFRIILKIEINEEINQLKLLVLNHQKTRFLDKINEFNFEKLKIDSNNVNLVNELFEIISLDENLILFPALVNLTFGHIEYFNGFQLTNKLDNFITLKIGNISYNKDLTKKIYPEEGLQLPALNKLRILIIENIDAALFFPKFLDSLEILVIRNINAPVSFPESLNNLETLYIENINFSITLPTSLNSLKTFVIQGSELKMVMPKSIPHLQASFKEKTSIFSKSKSIHMLNVPDSLEDSGKISNIKRKIYQDGPENSSSTIGYSIIKILEKLGIFEVFDVKELFQSALVQLPNPLKLASVNHIAGIYSNDDTEVGAFVLSKSENFSSFRIQGSLMPNKLTTLIIENIDQDLELADPLNSLKTLIIKRIYSNGTFELPELNELTSLTIEEMYENSILILPALNKLKVLIIKKMHANATLNCYKVNNLETFIIGEKDKISLLILPRSLHNLQNLSIDGQVATLKLPPSGCGLGIFTINSSDNDLIIRFLDPINRSKNTFLGTIEPNFEMQKLTPEKVKPHLRYMAQSSYAHNPMSKKLIAPFGYEPVDPGSIGIVLSGILSDVEILAGSVENSKTGESTKTEKCFVDRNTGLKIVVSVNNKMEEIVIAFGDANSLQAELKEASYIVKLKHHKSVLKNLAGTTPRIYQQANILAKQIIERMLQHSQYYNYKITLVGQSLGGSLAQFVGLSNGIKTFCYNAVPLGKGVQELIGDKKLSEAKRFITHLTVETDFVSDTTKNKSAWDWGWTLDSWIKTSGNFGHRYSIPTAYPKEMQKTHSFVLGSAMKFLNFSERQLPQGLTGNREILMSIFEEPSYEILENKEQLQVVLNYWKDYLKMQQSLFLGNYSDIARALNNVGMAYCMLGGEENLLTGLKCLENSLKIRKELFSGNHPYVALSLSNVGQAYMRLGGEENIKNGLGWEELDKEKLQKGLQYKKAALKMLQALLPGNHATVVLFLEKLGFAYLCLQNFHKGLKYVEESVNMEQELHPDHFSRKAAFLLGAGIIYSLDIDKEDILKGLKYFDEALKMNRELVNRDLRVEKDILYVLSHMERVLSMVQEPFSGNHAVFANSFNTVGLAYCELGGEENILKGLKYLREALRIRQVLFPGDHPAVADSLNYIGQAYCELERKENILEGLKYLRKALKMKKILFPEDHPEVADSFNSVGLAYWDLKGAENILKGLKYLKEALRMGQALFPSNHPVVASSLSNIGLAYCELEGEENTMQGLKYQKKALRMRKSLFPGNHPAVADCLNYIGQAYYSLGGEKNILQALKYQEEALRMGQALFPGNHPALATYLNNVGLDYYWLEGEENTQQALKYLEEGLKMRKALFSDIHIDVAYSLNNIGLVYCDLERDENFFQGLKYHEEALKIYRELAYRGLAGEKDILHGLNFLERALDMYPALFPSNPSNHSIVVNLLFTIGLTYYSLRGKENIRRGLDYQLEALATGQELFRGNHKDIAIFLNTIGLTYYDLGGEENIFMGLKYQEEALNMGLSLFPYNHYLVAASLQNVAAIYNKLGDTCKFLEYSKQAYSIFFSIKDYNITERIKSSIEFLQPNFFVEKSFDIKLQEPVCLGGNSVGSEYRWIITNRGEFNIEQIKLKQKIQKEILDQIIQMVNEYVFSICDLPSNYINMDYLEKNMNEMGLDANNIEFAQMLCFEAMNFGIIKLEEKPYEIIEKFTQENRELVEIIAIEHPEFFVDGSIVEACVRAVPNDLSFAKHLFEYVKYMGIEERKEKYWKKASGF